MEKRVYSVGKINTYIKNLIGSDLILGDVAVKGEISNCKYNHSGHIYFSLKDETGVLQTVMFKSSAAKLRFHLEDGMEVIVHGRIGVYEKSGSYQLYASSIEKSGTGDLYKKFEELKARLEESGMFSAEYKKPIPRFSYNIGVVTAKTGAVINDIRNVAKRRNPYAKITLYSAKVQGEGAAEEICAGIEALDGLGLDCIIVGRGGGSIEDLWAFNEESVARAIFNCSTPVISAVGHETDFTIADFVSDLRAPTPSAAAELAVFDYYRFMQDLRDIKYTLDNCMGNSLEREKEKTKNYKLLLERYSPENSLLTKKQDLMNMEDKLERAMQDALRKKKELLSRYSFRLEGLSPLKRFSEGYAYVTDKDGKALKSISQAKEGEEIGVNVSDGTIRADIREIKEVKYE